MKGFYFLKKPFDSDILMDLQEVTKIAQWVRKVLCTLPLSSFSRTLKYILKVNKVCCRIAYRVGSYLCKNKSKYVRLQAQVSLGNRS